MCELYIVFGLVISSVYYSTVGQPLQASAEFSEIFDNFKCRNGPLKTASFGLCAAKVRPRVLYYLSLNSLLELLGRMMTVSLADSG